MANGRIRLAAGLILAAILGSAIGCGSVGENNTNTRAKQTLNKNDPKMGTKYLQDRQKRLVQHAAPAGSEAKAAALSAGPRYLHDTGRSKVRPAPQTAVAKATQTNQLGTGKYVHDRGVSKVKQAPMPKKTADIKKAAEAQASEVNANAKQWGRWWSSKPLGN